MAIPIVESGQTFAFYSVGDALFLSRVINGVAMLNNSGLLMTLGAIGLMIGLIRAGFVAVTSNGKQIELSHLVGSIILLFGMFGIKANVQINDIMGPPFGNEGIATPTIISNVPYGVAVAGWAISSFGYNLAERFEQGFGRPGSSFGGVTNGGFGKGLAWINAVRNLDIPEINDRTGEVAAFKKNMTSYLAHCFLPAAHRNRANIETAFTVDNIFRPISPAADSGAGGGILVTDAWSGFDWQGPTGITFMSCAQAGQTLDLMSRNSFYSATANALAGRAMKWAASPESQLTDAFEQVGISSDKARAYVTNMAIASVWNDAIRTGSFSDSDALASIMISQAKQSRANQWAAEESMWKSTSQGFTGFFEGMLFACAPFMALALGVGTWGHRVIFRYLILTAWVALWLPVLAMINLFQVTTIEHAVDSMRNAMMYGADTSLASTMLLSTKIVDWIAVGSTLSAATPVITLSLLMGGAITATALASRMHGADHVNERVLSPDVTNAPSAMSDSSVALRDSAQGLRLTGSDSAIPKISMSTLHGVNTASKQSEAWSASENASIEMGRVIQSQIQRQGSFSVEAASGSQGTFQANESRFAAAAKRAGVDIGSDAAAAIGAVATLVASGGVTASNPGKGLGGLMGQMGISGTDQQQEAINHATKLGEIMGLNTQQGHELRYAANQLLSESVGIKSATTATDSQSSTGSDSFKKALSESRQKQSAWEQSQTESRSVGMSQDINLANAATTALQNGQGNAIREAAIQYGPGGATGLRTQENAIAATPWGKNGSAELRSAEASIAQLYRAATHDGPYRQEAADALLQAMGSGGQLNLGAASALDARPSANRGIGPELEAGAVPARVDASGVGAGFDHQGVAGAVGAVQGDASGLLTDHASRVGAGALLPDLDTRVAAGQFAANPESVDGRLGEYLAESEREVREASQDQRDTLSKTQEASGTGGALSSIGSVFDSPAVSERLRAAEDYASGARPTDPGNDLFGDPYSQTAQVYAPYESSLHDMSRMDADPGYRASINSEYAATRGNPDVLAQYGFSSGVANEHVAGAMYVMAAIEKTGSVTPEMLDDYRSHLGAMTDTQRQSMEEFVQKGAGGNTADAWNYTALGGMYVPGR